MEKRIFRLAIGLLIFQALVNLISVLGPELGFDALFYHLTLPKLFLLQGRWYYPGLLYVSAMPRLAETLFIPALKLLGTQGPKLIQFFAGLLSAGLTYKLSRRFTSRPVAIVAALLFYNTWLVSWQSGSAYIDLILTLFQLTAVYFLLKPNRTSIFSFSVPSWVLSGVFFGLAIGTKWHALPSLLLAGLIFNPLIIPVALLIASPWFYLAYHFTGNPIYPLLESSITQSQLAQVSSHFHQPLQIIKRLLLSPLYLGKPYDALINPLLTFIFPLGLVIFLQNKDSRYFKLSLFVLGSIFIWLLTPPPSGRYLLPVLPLIALISSQVLKLKKPPFRRLALLLVFSTTFMITLGRLWANSKYLPVILGRQTKNQFLLSQKQRLPDTFIDADGWVAANIDTKKKVLVQKLHNLYYLPVNFDHLSWADSDYPYPYLITQNQDPASVKGELLHTNSLGIQVFKID